jgi:hypothetical protein
MVSVEVPPMSKGLANFKLLVLPNLY